MCLLPPIGAKQCPQCNKLICSDCYKNSPHCQHCSHTLKTSIKYTEIKDRILRGLIDTLIRYKHKCTDKGDVKIFSESEMIKHKNSFECPSKVYKCFCQSANDEKRYSYNDIFEHLRNDCPDVIMHC